MVSTEQLYEIFRLHPIVSIDSRRIETGCLFFALRGEHFDGNQFAAQAIDKGAAYAIVDDPKVAIDDRYLLVPDVLKALQDLAQHYRQTFSIPVVAIAGSNGKTTTKELLTAVLSKLLKTHATPGNLNNHIGVPLTLLAMPPDTQIAVVELGANHLGENRLLCEIAMPTHGLVTNIGQDHLEGFGGIEGVKKANAELYAYLAQQGGTAFVHADDPVLLDLVPPDLSVIYYGQKGLPRRAALELATEVELLEWVPTVKLALGQASGKPLVVTTHLPGKFNFHNIMAAVAVGRYFGLPDDLIAEAIAAYVPQNLRSQWIEWGKAKVFLDAYNANPSSMRKALEYFAALPNEKKAVILGEMKELGEFTRSAHEELAKWVSTLGIDCIILIGEAFREPALQTGALHFENTQALKGWLEEQSFEDYVILVKGSRSNRLEQLFTTQPT